VCLVLTLVFGIVFLILHKLTEGVQGTGRRIYPMLLLFLSAVVAGLVMGVILILTAAAFLAGVYVFALAVGIPLSALTWLCYGRITHTSSLDKPVSGSATFNRYLNWIKRVAQGKKKWR
jgi:hypothetical protein